MQNTQSVKRIFTFILALLAVVFQEIETQPPGGRATKLPGGWNGPKKVRDDS